ncbi:hypothetical protein [Pseudomonas oryzihabitans]|uniref:hypothetical protein n=1 Tax=Pseudomonas oryzihabitans TaxID=47885 RepID=UPI0011101C34|nr:hypothetical protein [Pseudomonas psychrotolerans]
MDIAELYKLNRKFFGDEQTLAVIAKVDDFLEKQVKGITGRGHDPREQMRTSNTRLVGTISQLTKCSARVAMSRGANKSVFFPEGFVAALESAFMENLHSKKDELSDKQRDDLGGTSLSLGLRGQCIPSSALSS